MPADYSIILFPIFMICFGTVILCSGLWIPIGGPLAWVLEEIVIYSVGMIAGISLLVAGILCCRYYRRDKYLNLVDNKIKIRTNYFCRFVEKVYNKEDIIKSELKYDEKKDSEDGSITYNYTISIITKEDNQIDIFRLREINKIDNMDGLNSLVNYLNYYIQNKREMY